MKLSLRLQLTVWYTAAIIALFAVLFLTLNHFLGEQLVGDLDDFLYTYSLSVDDQAKVLTAVSDSGRELQSTLDTVDTQVSLPSGKRPLFARVISPQGTVIASRPRTYRDLPAPSVTGLANSEDEAVYDDRDLPGLGRTRTLLRPLLNGDGQVIGYLEIGDSLRQVHAALSNLQRTLGWQALGGGLLALAVGYFIAWRGLKSLDRVVAHTDRVHEKNLLQRLPKERRPAEIQHLVDSFNALLERVERAFEHQKRFSADVSHELRTPLAALRAQIEVMLMDPDLPAELRLKLADLETETLRLIQLASNLLLLAQLEEGALIERSQVEVVPLVHEVYREARLLSNGRRMVIAHEEPCTVLGDRSLLKQVFLNLLSNAIKYTDEDGRIEVSVKASNSHVDVAVADNGAGIPRDALPRIFEPFFRADKSRSRATGGAGLGLAISKRIVDRHGGKIEIQSTEGHGTQVTVSLPGVAPA